MAESRGMLIIRTDDTSILFRAALFNTSNNKVTTGTTNLRIWHVIPTTGALETFDFDDDTFKAGAITTAVLAMSHRTAENSTYDTGIWTVRQATLTAFTKGDKYIAEVSNSGSIHEVHVEFQYGDCEGDQRVDLPDDVWDEDVTAHVAGSSAGAALDALGTALDGRTNSANLNALLAVPDVAANTIAEPIWDEALAGHISTGSIGRALQLGGLVLAETTIGGVPTSTTFDLVAGSAVDNFYTDLQVVMLSGAAAGQARVVSAYTGASKTVIVDEDWIGAIVATDAVSIRSLHAHSKSQIADAMWDEANSGHVAAGSVGLHLNALGALIAARANNATLDALLSVPDTALHTIADTIMEFDVTTASLAQDTVAAILARLNLTGRASGFVNIADILGVPDTVGATVTTEVWEELLASHVTANTMGEVMNTLSGGFGGVWEELVASHTTVNTFGALAGALDLTGRTNTPTLDGLFAVPDTAGVNLPDTIWEEDLTTHTTSLDSAGRSLFGLGHAIVNRTNNPTLGTLLSVVDTANADISWTILDEIADGSNHTTADSVGQRIVAVDTITEVGGAGDLASNLVQTLKIDTNPVGVTDPDSIAGKLDGVITTLSTADRQVVMAINLQSDGLRIEAAVTQQGLVMLTPWTRLAAQIFNEVGTIITGGTIGIGDFGSIGTRGFFTFTRGVHGVIAGQVYQIEFTFDNGPAQTQIFQSTVPFLTIQG